MYTALWAKAFKRSMAALTRSSVGVGKRVVGRAIKDSVDRLRPPPGDGDWIAGVAIGLKGVRRFRLYRPPDVKRDEQLPLLVMLHGCGQDARSFAASTRMNRVAARERFFVLYPEQDRLANAQGCWNWFDTDGGRADGDAALIMKAIDQVCLMYPVDPTRIAVAGLSAGASMAALLVTRHPERFKALIMLGHSTWHGAFRHVGARCHAWPTPHQALGGHLDVDGRCVATAVGDTWRGRPHCVGQQRACGGADLGGRGRRAGWSDPPRAARQALPHDGDQLQAPRAHGRHAGRGRAARPRMEWRCSQTAVQ